MLNTMIVTQGLARYYISTGMPESRAVYKRVLRKHYDSIEVETY